MTGIRLAIVGGGPSCTYVLERLAATAPHIHERFGLAIHIFEKTGEFGSGAVHSTTQPDSSLLNRIAAQVGFAADETVAQAGPLLPSEMRPSLYQWCLARYAETGDQAFNLEPESWPRRNVHGLALQDAFRAYVGLLRAQPSLRVHLHHAEVTAVQKCPGGFSIVATGATVTNLLVDHVLFLTGHSVSDPQRSETLISGAEFAQNENAVYVPHAYPLERMIPAAAVSAGRVVGINGMGLTAIDVILYLTEGRGGRFEKHPVSGRLVYYPCGAEPASIVAFGNAGLFTFARPFNAKERDPETLEHKPVFLTEAAVDRMRITVGRPLDVKPFGVRRQLDFERDILPLVLLEMACVYYRTLLGDNFGDCLEQTARPAYKAFLEGAAGAMTPAQASALLLTPVENVVNKALNAIERALGENPSRRSGRGSTQAWSLDAAVKRYRTVVFGADSSPPSWGSPHGHSLLPTENRFSWDRLIHPIPPSECVTPDRYRDALIAFMDRDHLWAAQNNVENPQKAATDGVWRDLRQVLAYAIDFGGLTARSHHDFIKVYMRHHNRLANGAALEVMQKIQALIIHGVVDPSIGPRATVTAAPGAKGFTVRGPVTGAERQLDTLIDARVHGFDPSTDQSPLYPQLLRSGLIRKWRNPDGDGGGFEPGGLELDMDFHPVGADGRVETRLTFLGPPSEGVMFFQLGALRPNQNHHVMRDIIRWVRHFWAEVATICGGQGGPGAPVLKDRDAIPVR